MRRSAAACTVLLLGACSSGGDTIATVDGDAGGDPTGVIGDSGDDA